LNEPSIVRRTWHEKTDNAGYTILLKWTIHDEPERC
jgi:hypothetical protein